MTVTNQFRIGLYPFIRYLYAYFALTSSINGSPTNSSTINYAAANLASQLDTNINSNLGSGGTHFENAFPSMNTLITSVGDGSASNNTLPYVFLITDGAQDPQVKALNGGGWSGSNHATVLDPTHCASRSRTAVSSFPCFIFPISRYKIQTPRLPEMKTAMRTTTSPTYRPVFRPARRRNSFSRQIRPRTLPPR